MTELCQNIGTGAEHGLEAKLSLASQDLSNGTCRTLFFSTSTGPSAACRSAR
jgi:hypothetical protein